jgi:predicted ATPase
VPDFPGGVFFVDLSLVAEPALVSPHVAAALDVREEVDRELEQLIADRVRHTEVLIVLDNCEHLREPSARFAQRLLGAAPSARILATSREPLGAPGETNFPVPPLGLPAGDAAADELRSAEAIRLFLERVQAVRPQIGSNTRVVEAAARICVDLDGLPLAIELAAARAKALSLDEIAARLDDRFRFLVSWRRLSPARHRTLLETMDWSYELLSEDEQAVLSGLSLFAGGFTLDAAAAVCVSSDDSAALEAVERLVDASLVVAEERDDGMRFRLLETVRQHAARRLKEPAAAEVSTRHADYYLELAERVIGEVELDGNLTPLARLDSEDANLRAALAQFERTDRAEAALRMCAALWRYWWFRGEFAEGRRLVGASLAGFAAAATPTRVEALRDASTLALRQADYDSATDLARESVGLAEQLGDPLVISQARMALANAVGSLGDYEEAERLYHQSADGFRDAGRGWELANALLNMADLALHVGDMESVERLANESLALCRASGDESGTATNLGNLAFAALERGDPEQAHVLLVEALERAHRLGFRELVATIVEGLAAAAVASGASADAARLLGASARIQEEIGMSLGPFETRLHERTVEAARDSLGEDGFAAEWTAGRELSADDARALAMTA